QAADGPGCERGARRLQRPGHRAGRGAAPAEQAERPAQPHPRGARRARARRRSGLLLRVLRSERQEQPGGRGPAPGADARHHSQLRAGPAGGDAGAQCSPAAGAEQRERNGGEQRAGHDRYARWPRRPRHSARAVVAGRRSVPLPSHRRPLHGARRSAQGHRRDQRRRGGGQDGGEPQPRDGARRDRLTGALARGRPAPPEVPSDTRGQRRPAALERARWAGGAGARDSRARSAPALLRPGGVVAPKPRRSRELPADAPGSRVPAVAIRLRDHRHAARAAGDGRGRAREGGRRGAARGEGAWKPERAGPRGPRSAVDGRRAPPRRGRERRGSGLGGPVSVRLLLPAATAGGLRMSLPAVGQSDRKVLLALQGLVLGLPLFLGGRQPWALAAASAVVLVLLAVTIRERRRRGPAPYPPGIAALVEEDDARAAVFDRLLLTLLAAGALLAGLGLLSEATGIGIAGASASAGRVSGPFVNPNHFAAWLGMVVPAALAYAVALTGLVYGRLRRAVDAERGKGTQPRQAWLWALITHQRRLW